MARNSLLGALCLSCLLFAACDSDEPEMMVDEEESTGVEELHPACQAGDSPALALGDGRGMYVGDISEIELGFGYQGFPHLLVGLQAQYFELGGAEVAFTVEIDGLRTITSSYKAGLACSEEDGAALAGGLELAWEHACAEELIGQTAHITATLTNSAGDQLVAEADWMILEPTVEVPACSAG